MNASDILKLKRSFFERLDELRAQLNLSGENDHIPELQEFHLRKGLSKWWFFVRHKETITAAAEYESLLRLISDAPVISPQDQDLLHLFANGRPAQEYQIQDKKISASIEQLKTSLKTSLESPTLTIGQKNDLIREFWYLFHNQLSQSQNTLDIVMCRYMQERTDLGLKATPIYIREPEVVHKAPSFFENLPSSGNQADFLQAIGSQPTPQLKKHSTLNAPLIQIKISTSTRIFWFFSYTFLEDVETRVTARKEALQEATNVLRQARRISADYMDAHITHLKESMSAWQQPARRVQAPKQTAPVESKSATDNLLNFVAPFIPNMPNIPAIPGITGNASTAQQKTPANNPVPEQKSWFSSFW